MRPCGGQTEQCPPPQGTRPHGLLSVSAHDPPTQAAGCAHGSPRAEPCSTALQSPATMHARCMIKLCLERAGAICACFRRVLTSGFKVGYKCAASVVAVVRWNEFLHGFVTQVRGVTGCWALFCRSPVDLSVLLNATMSCSGVLKFMAVVLSRLLLPSL